MLLLRCCIAMFYVVSFLCCLFVLSHFAFAFASAASEVRWLKTEESESRGPLADVEAADGLASFS